MKIIHLLLDIYLAAVLGTTGISKIDNPIHFVATLRTQYKLSPQIAQLLGKLFPWTELLLAMLLLLATGEMKLVVTLAVFFLFLLFLTFHIIAQVRGLTQNCGCYGGIPESNRYTNYGTLLLQALLAGGLVVLMVWTQPLSWKYYLLSSIIVIGFASWLLWKTWQRHILIRKKQGNYSSYTSS